MTEKSQYLHSHEVLPHPSLLFQMWPTGGAAGRVSETHTGGLGAEAECGPIAGAGGEGCCGPAAKSSGKDSSC